MMMKHVSLWLPLVTIALVGLVAAVEDGGATINEDLPADSQLRIGIKHRPNKCDTRTQPGDTVSMHYTVRLLSRMVLRLS